MPESEPTVLSLLPLALTLVIAFVTRSALIAMISGTFVGTLLLGGVPGSAFDRLLRNSLGNPDFIWICEIVVLIGILFELFRRSRVLAELAQRFSSGAGGRRKAALTTWAMGFMIVDDYFSPLITGAVMRPVTDRAGIPREKLAFLLDSTTASVCILVPFTAWGAYLASLIASSAAPVENAEQGLSVFIAAIPYNIYPLLLIALTALIAAGLVPDVGPMRRAERRAAETGALIRPGARPLAEDEELDVESDDGPRPLLLLELAVPVFLLVAVAAWSLWRDGSVRIVEAFLLADSWLIAVLWWRGRLGGLQEVGEVITSGATKVMPALLIVAMAYALNAVTAELGAADYLVAQLAGELSPNTLVALTFFLAAVMSFATGTSWGTFALMMPLSLPLAVEFSGGSLGPLVYQTVAAVAGGGIFGDHASPLSDTSVLSSVGAGSDHMDHVVTQLPYALGVGVVTVGVYLLIV